MSVMPKVCIQEVRRLVLPIDTAVDAVLELDRSNGGTLANARLTQVRVETGEQPGLSLILMQGAGSPAAATQKRYTLAAIAAAAIHYCYRARIPLPRHATKSIEMVPEGFQLTIQTTTELPCLHDAMPLVSPVELTEDATGTSDMGQEPVEATGDAALDDPTSDDSGNSSNGVGPATAAA